MTVMRKLLFVLCCLWVSDSGAERITTAMITRQWNGAYSARIVIPILDKPVETWTLRFEFDSPLQKLELWTPQVVNHTSTVWNTESKPEMYVLPPGKDFTVDFNVHYDGNTPVLGSYYFNAVKYGTLNVSTTTQAQTATPSSSATTINSTTPSTTTTTTTPGVRSSPDTISPTTVTQAVTIHRPPHNYSEALRLSTLFYDAQRSGHLSSWNNPISWRNDSALNDSYRGYDLSGGWYNDGAHVKFNMPMSFSTWVLEWGILEFSKAYMTHGQTSSVCNMIKWPLEYFLKCWLPDEQTLFVQVGDANNDRAYWGPPENMTMHRPAYKVTSQCRGSDVAADTVSALAAGFLVFRYACSDSRFSTQLMYAAESLYKFAKNNRGVYSDCVTKYDQMYDSDNDEDELATAAAWMYKATKDPQYLTDAKSFYQTGSLWDFSWNDVNVASALLLYEITNETLYRNDIEAFVTSYQTNLTYTPCGLVWRDQWGPNRYAANAAFIAMMAAHQGIQPDEYKTWAMSQVNYLLGDNKMNTSYEIGYGQKYPLYPHHRGSSCSGTTDPCIYLNPNPNPNILYGGLVGGPDINDNYVDRRSNYVQNEVALDFNAGFQSTLAGLVYYSDINELPTAPTPKC